MLRPSRPRPQSPPYKGGGTGTGELLREHGAKEPKISKIRNKEKRSKKERLRIKTTKEELT